MSPQPAIPTPGVGFGRDTQHLPPGFRLLPSAPLPHRPLHQSYSPGFLCPLLPRPCWGGSSGHRGGRAALTPERCRSLCPREGSGAVRGAAARARQPRDGAPGAAPSAPHPAARRERRHGPQGSAAQGSARGQCKSSGKAIPSPPHTHSCSSPAATTGTGDSAPSSCLHPRAAHWARDRALTANKVLRQRIEPFSLINTYCVFNCFPFACQPLPNLPPRRAPLNSVCVVFQFTFYSHHAFQSVRLSGGLSRSPPGRETGDHNSSTAPGLHSTGERPAPHGVLGFPLWTGRTIPFRCRQAKQNPLH